MFHVKIGKRNIGRYLLQSSLESFLCTEMTLAVFRPDGNTPIEKEILQMSEIDEMKFHLKQFKNLCRYAIWTSRLV